MTMELRLCYFADFLSYYDLQIYKFCSLLILIVTQNYHYHNKILSKHFILTQKIQKNQTIIHFDAAAACVRNITRPRATLYFYVVCFYLTLIQINKHQLIFKDCLSVCLYISSDHFIANAFSYHKRRYTTKRCKMQQVFK